MNRIINSSLSKAIYNDDLEDLRHLLKIGTKSNIQDNTGWTPLHSAIQKNRSDMVELLLTQPDAPLNSQCFEGETPLFLACSTKSSYRLIKSLLIAGADPKIANNEDVTPLHVATEPEIVELLLTFGADVNRQDFNSYTPLHNAVEKNQVEIAEILIKAGADTSLCELNGLTPLMVSFQYDFSRIDLLLEATSNLNVVAKDGWSALMLAINSGKINIALKLIQKGANVNIVAESFTPLHLAVLKQEEHLFQILWEKIDSNLFKNLQDLPHLMLIHRWYVPERLEYFFNVLGCSGIFTEKNRQSFLEFLFRFERDNKLELVICDIVSKICYSNQKFENCNSRIEIGSRLQNSHQNFSPLHNFHPQNSNLNPLNYDSQPQHLDLHSENCCLHQKSWNLERNINSNQNYCLRSQNREIPSKNIKSHPQNCNLQSLNCHSRPQNCNMPQNCHSKPQNCNLQPQNSNLHPQNCNSHPQNSISHPQNSNLHSQNCNMHPEKSSFHSTPFKINSQSLICFIENFSNCDKKFKLIDILLQSGVATFDNKIFSMVAVKLDPEIIPKLLTLTLAINPTQIFTLFTKEVRMDMPMLNLLMYLIKFCTPKKSDTNNCLQKLKRFNPYSAKRVKYTLNGIDPISQVQMSRIVDYEITPEDREVMCDIYNKVEKVLEEKRLPSLKELARDTIRNKMYVSQKYIRNCDNFFKNYGLPRDINDIILLRKGVNSF